MVQKCLYTFLDESQYALTFQSFYVYFIYFLLITIAANLTCGLRVKQPGSFLFTHCVSNESFVGQIKASITLVQSGCLICVVRCAAGWDFLTDAQME